LDPEKEFRCVAGPFGPVVQPGAWGLFDDSGCAMGCLVSRGGLKHLFYLGWNLKMTVPWMNTIGLSVAPEGSVDFIKHGRVPVMDRSEEDPYSISYPFILEEGGRYRMWYGSNLNWGKDQSEMCHVIKYAESQNLLNWQRTGQVHVGLEHPGEYALSRPWVLRRGGGRYLMWYSYRARGVVSSYRIGMATSTDGEHWLRQDDHVGIDVSPSGWDSEMLCYAAVFEWEGKLHMLYNGNGYGKTGFGLAHLTDESV
jgi:predicted GH43/DUF377 family glycosyl hydrolase